MLPNWLFLVARDEGETVGWENGWLSCEALANRHAPKMIFKAIQELFGDNMTMGSRI